MLYKREVLLTNQMGYFNKVEHGFIPTNNKIQSGDKLDVSYFQGMHAPYIYVFRKHNRFMVLRTVVQILYYCSYTTQNSERTFFLFIIML